MRGSALWFAQKLRYAHPPKRSPTTGGLAVYDLIVCTGLLDLAAFRSLVGPSPPVLLYCHETQITYPARSENDADLHFAFTDLVNMLCADGLAFNSASHRNEFLSRLPAFIRKFPEHRPSWTLDEIHEKSVVCHPGIELSDARLANRNDGHDLKDGPPLVIWNHRWEFDKNPRAVFAALGTLVEQGTPFEVALLGERFKTIPDEFVKARDHLGNRIKRYGYEPDRRRYMEWLRRGDVVVSTAIQENFGISILEAVACGCFPLLPSRLSYPEIIPDDCHSFVLYDDDSLAVRLTQTLNGETPPRGIVERLSAHARSFDWSNRITEFDELMEQTAENPRR